MGGLRQVKPTEKMGSYGKEYVTKSNVIVVLFILIDIRLKPQDIDISFLNYYGKKIFINIIFTKCDKINQKILIKILIHF